MARIDFGDLDFEFSHKNLSQENYLKLKDEYFNLYQALCSKHQSISDYGIIYEWVDFNDENKSIDIIIPRNWQQNELFVLFVLQKKALSILDIPGFHRHIPSHLNDFSPEAKDDFFKFCNQFLKEIDGEFYANWQVFTDGMYWSCGIEVYHNNDEDYVKVDYRQDAYEEEEDEMEERGEKKMEVDKNQTIQLNQINDFIRDIHNNDVDLSLNEDKKTITIPHNFEEWELSNFEEFKFFKEIKNLLTKPFEIWYTFEIDGEWFINFLLYDGELLWSYQTDDINDFILSLDELSDDYDDERGEILARINEGILDDDNYPLLPKSSDKGEYKPEEYSLLK